MSSHMKLLTRDGSSSYMLSHSRSNRDPLRASSNRVGSVLDIGARHDRAAGQEQGAADVEFRVWAC